MDAMKAVCEETENYSSISLNIQSKTMEHLRLIKNFNPSDLFFDDSTQIKT